MPDKEQDEQSISRDGIKISLTEDLSSIDWSTLTEFIRNESYETNKPFDSELLTLLNNKLADAKADEFPDLSLRNLTYLLRLIDESDESKVLLNTVKNKLEEYTNAGIVSNSVIGSLGLNLRFLLKQRGLREYVERLQDFLIGQLQSTLGNTVGINNIIDSGKSVSEKVSDLFKIAKNIREVRLFESSPTAQIVYGLKDADPEDSRVQKLLTLATLHFAANTYKMGYKPGEKIEATKKALAKKHQIADEIVITTLLEGIRRFPEHAAALLPVFNANIKAYPDSFRDLDSLAVAESLTNLQDFFVMPNLSEKAKATLQSLYLLSGQPAQDWNRFQYEHEREEEIYRLLKDGKSNLIRFDEINKKAEVDFHGPSYPLARTLTKAILAMVAIDHQDFKGFRDIEFITGKGNTQKAKLGLMRDTVESECVNYGVSQTFTGGSTLINKSDLWVMLADSDSLTPRMKVSIAFAAAKHGQLFDNNRKQLNSCLEVSLEHLDIHSFLNYVEVLVVAHSYEIINEEKISDAVDFYINNISKDIFTYPFSVEEKNSSQRKIEIWESFSEKFSELCDEKQNERINISVAEEFTKLSPTSISEISEDKLIKLANRFCQFIENDSCKNAVTKIANLLENRYKVFNENADESILSEFTNAFTAALDKNINEKTRELLNKVIHRIKMNGTINRIHDRLDNKKGIGPLANAFGLYAEVLSPEVVSRVVYYKNSSEESQKFDEKELRNILKKASNKKLFFFPFYPIDLTSEPQAYSPNNLCKLFIYDERDTTPVMHIYSPLIAEGITISEQEVAIAKLFQGIVEPEGNIEIDIRKHVFHPNLKPLAETSSPEHMLAIEVIHRQLAGHVGANPDYVFKEIYQADVENDNGEIALLRNDDKEIFVGELILELQRGKTPRAAKLMQDAHLRFAAVEAGDALIINREILIETLLSSSDWQAFILKQEEHKWEYQTKLKILKKVPRTTSDEYPDRNIKYFLDAINAHSPTKGSANEIEEKEAEWKSFIDEQNWSGEQKSYYGLVRQECISLLESKNWQVTEASRLYPNSRGNLKSDTAGLIKKIEEERNRKLEDFEEKKLSEAITKELVEELINLAKAMEIASAGYSLVKRDSINLEKGKRKKKQTRVALTVLEAPSEEISNILVAFYACLNNEHDIDALIKFNSFLKRIDQEKLAERLGPHISTLHIKNELFSENLQNTIDDDEDYPRVQKMSKGLVAFLKSSLRKANPKDKSDYQGFVLEYSDDATGKRTEELVSNEGWHEDYFEYPQQHAVIVFGVIGFWSEFRALTGETPEGKSFDELLSIARNHAASLPRILAARINMDWIDDEAIPFIKDRFYFKTNKQEWLLRRIGNEDKVESKLFLIRQKNYLHRPLSEDFQSRGNAILPKIINQAVLYYREATDSEDCWSKYKDDDYLKDLLKEIKFTQKDVDLVRTVATHYLMHPELEISTNSNDMLMLPYNGYQEKLKAIGWSAQEDVAIDIQNINQAADNLFSDDELSGYFSSDVVRPKFTSNLISWVLPKVAFKLAYCLQHEDDNTFSSEIISERRRLFIDGLTQSIYANTNQVIIVPLNDGGIDLPINGVEKPSQNWAFVVLDRRSLPIRVHAFVGDTNQNLSPTLNLVIGEIQKYGQGKRFNVVHTADVIVPWSNITDTQSALMYLTSALVERCDIAIPLYDSPAEYKDDLSPSLLKDEIAKTINLEKYPEIMAAIESVNEGDSGSIEILATLLTDNQERQSFNLDKLKTKYQDTTDIFILFERVQQITSEDIEKIPPVIRKNLSTAIYIYKQQCENDFSNEEKRKKYVSDRKNFFLKNEDKTTADRVADLFQALVNLVDTLGEKDRLHDVSDWSLDNIDIDRNKQLALSTWNSQIQEKILKINADLIRPYFQPQLVRFVESAIDQFLVSDDSFSEKHLIRACNRRPVADTDTLIEMSKRDEFLMKRVDPYLIRSLQRWGYQDAEAHKEKLLKKIFDQSYKDTPKVLDRLLMDRERSAEILSTPADQLIANSDDLKSVLKFFKQKKFNGVADLDTRSPNQLNFDRRLEPFGKEVATLMQEILKCWWRRPHLSLTGNIDDIRKRMLSTVELDILQIKKAKHNIDKLMQADASLEQKNQIHVGLLLEKAQILSELRDSRDSLIEFSKELKDILDIPNLASKLETQATEMQGNIRLYWRKMDGFQEAVQNQSVDGKLLSDVKEVLEAFRKESFRDQIFHLTKQSLLSVSKQKDEEIKQLTEKIIDEQNILRRSLQAKHEELSQLSNVVSQLEVTDFLSLELNEKKIKLEQTIRQSLNVLTKYQEGEVVQDKIIPTSIAANIRKDLDEIEKNNFPRQVEQFNEEVEKLRAQKQQEILDKVRKERDLLLRQQKSQVPSTLQADIPTTETELREGLDRIEQYITILSHPQIPSELQRIDLSVNRSVTDRTRGLTNKTSKFLKASLSDTPIYMTGSHTIFDSIESMNTDSGREEPSKSDQPKNNFSGVITNLPKFWTIGTNLFKPLLLAQTKKPPTAADLMSKLNKNLNRSTTSSVLPVDRLKESELLIIKETFELQTPFQVMSLKQYLAQRGANQCLATTLTNDAHAEIDGTAYLRIVQISRDGPPTPKLFAGKEILIPVDSKLTGKFSNDQLISLKLDGEKLDLKSASAKNQQRTQREESEEEIGSTSKNISSGGRKSSISSK